MNATPLKLSGTYYTVEHAAAVAGMTSGRVRQMAREGIVRIVPIGERSYLIPAAEVRRICKPAKTGRPRRDSKKKIET